MKLQVRAVGLAVLCATIVGGVCAAEPMDASRANGDRCGDSTGTQGTLIGTAWTGRVPATDQANAAMGVVTRLLGEKSAAHFRVEILPPHEGNDRCEVEAVGGKIVLRGSNGVSACRGLKWYLNERCQCSVTWCGDNLKLPDPLPLDFGPYRETTAFQYRYIFNNCIYGYSMAWWKWAEWERMLDVLAYNGINMPAMLLGQERIWQETYKEMGLDARDLDTFFAGPAWYPWQWMGNLDGWGGPTPQSVIDGQCELQKRILSRARSLGMKAVLPGFSGHIPKALVDRTPGIKCQTMEWWGFGPTYILDWQDPAFRKISSIFMRKQREIYGTDHYYNIDPFNEMTPPSSEKSYLSNMAKTIFSCIDESDPKGVWVLMTWFCKEASGTWTPERTKDFFDAVPNDRMLALELWGENWHGTGWHKQGGWYGKPWVWCILQDFGNRVDIYGGLPQIVDNYARMQKSPDRGDIRGMGIMTEGLGFNPVIYELVLDMMWNGAVGGGNLWEQKYLLKRYGSVPEPVRKAWDILYATRYNRTQLVDCSPLCFAPRLITEAEADMNLFEAWRLMLEGAPQLGGVPAYQFDLVNLGREAMGALMPRFTIAIQEALDRKDVEGLRVAGGKMLAYIRDFDRLLATNEHFLLGRWVAGARSWGSNDAEKALLEWGAKRQITDWGGKIGSYAIKEWSGAIADRMLPAWEKYLGMMEGDVRAGKQFDKARATSASLDLIRAWPDKRTDFPTEPVGDAAAVSRELFSKYESDMKTLPKTSGMEELSKGERVPGMAVGKPVTATGMEAGFKPELAVDGRLRGGYWGAVGPASLTVDLLEPREVAAFRVYPYRGDNRYYQYTIEVSADGENWMQVVDMSQNTDPASVKVPTHPFTAGYTFRYARLNMLKNSVNPSVHVIEFQVLSPGDMEKLSTKLD
jgi:alpha-N-acetylglucosaminidase